MAGSLTNYGEDAVLDLATALVVTIGLFTTDPGEASSGDEVAGDTYVRTAVSWNAASGGSTTNDGAVTFATAGVSWGSIAYWVGFDVSGNRIFHGDFTTPKTIDTGDTAEIADDGITITLD